MCELSPVTFHGDTIFCIEHQNQPYTPMRPIVENMGLDWKSQSAKLNANRGRWATVAIITTVAQDGREREMLCLPVRKLPAFLASINPRKVRPELRERIELYQAECDDALWDYWTRGKAERPAPGPARNIADDIIPTPPYAPALGWAGESVICAADGHPMRILQPLPASALQGPLREARAELGKLRQSLLRYVRGEANCAPGILLPMLDAVLDNVDELLLGLQRSPELR